MVRIAVINESTVVSDADVQAAVYALQTQVSRDFAPIWDAPAQINFHPSKIAPAGAWQLVILDDSDQADALGYHELTAEGLPIGKAFAKTDLQNGSSWTVTASHELLEILADPDISDCVELDNSDGSITMYAKEVCDAVEADNLGYQIQPEGATVGVLVSDFVTPAWFMANPPPNAQFSFRGNVNQAFALATGGYISILKIGSGATSGWIQVTARLGGELKPGGPIAPEGSRRWRRKWPDRFWRRSERGALPHPTALSSRLKGRFS